MVWWVGAAKWIRHTDKRLNINEETVSLTSPLSAALSRPADRFSHNSTVSPITDHLSAKQNGCDTFWTLLSAQLELCDKSTKGQSIAWGSLWTGLGNEEKRSGHRDISEAVTSCSAGFCNYKRMCKRLVSEVDGKILLNLCFVSSEELWTPLQKSS